MPSKVGWKTDPGKRVVATLLVLALDTLRLSVHRMERSVATHSSQMSCVMKRDEFEPFLRAVTASAPGRKTFEHLIDVDIVRQHNLIMPDTVGMSRSL